MKLVVYDDFRVGILGNDNSVSDISRYVPSPWRCTPHAMTALIADWDSVAPQLQRADALDSQPIDAVTLRPPIPAPPDILAAPSNYPDHVLEMDTAEVPLPLRSRTARDLGLFVKASGSVSGPSDDILLPDLPGRTFHHEAELAVVVGRMMRAVSASSAMDHVFGFTCLLDITLRTTDDLAEERSMRKSYATFTPIGRALVTRDEVGRHDDLEICLHVNGEQRQRASTSELIVDIPNLLSIASRVLPLRPGALVATGTPAGVGPIEPGDHLQMVIQHVSELDLRVERRAW